MVTSGELFKITTGSGDERMCEGNSNPWKCSKQFGFNVEFAVKEAGSKKLGALSDVQNERLQPQACSLRSQINRYLVLNASDFFAQRRNFLQNAGIIAVYGNI